MYGRKWKPSKAARAAFAEQMNEIEAFCKENGIEKSRSGDSYYFAIGQKKYRVSNHTVEASNAAAYRDGEQTRELYHEDGREADTVYIHAGKTRIMQIYRDLKNGLVLDGRGNVICRE